MIPVAYRIPGSLITIPIIDMSNITVQGVYDSQLIGVDFFQNTTQLLMNPLEIKKKFQTSKTTTIFTEDINGHFYESAKTDHVYETNSISLGGKF